MSYTIKRIKVDGWSRWVVLDTRYGHVHHSWTGSLEDAHDLCARYNIAEGEYGIDFRPLAR